MAHQAAGKHDVLSRLGIGILAIVDCWVKDELPVLDAGTDEAAGKPVQALDDRRVVGLQPGPMMFILNVDIIYGLFIGLIVSSFMLFLVGSVAIRGFRFVADVPKRILMPAVLVLCIYGVFAVNKSAYLYNSFETARDQNVAGLLAIPWPKRPGSSSTSAV